jgi:hypothetical protein
MALRDLAGDATPHAEVSALRRELTALLRWRLRWLPSVVPDRALRAARLVPVLLHASFERTRLSDDAPGVAGLRYRRSWSWLARAFDLPPPCRAQRGSPLVDAVVAIPSTTGLEVLVVVAPSLRPDDRRWVGDRAAGAQAVLAAQRTPLELRVLDPAALAGDRAAAHGAIAFGALLAGQLSPAAWGALESAARRPVGPDVLGALAAAAPTPLAGLALTLLSAAPAPAPLDVAARLLRRAPLRDRTPAAGVPARHLADASTFAIRWAAAAHAPSSPALQAALRLDEAVRRRPGRARAAAPSPVAAAPAPAGEVLALARALAVAAARAIRGARRHGIGKEARRAWREALGPEVPRALLPALRAALAGAPSGRIELVPEGPAVAARLAGAGVLGRGATPVQARIRALSVLAAAGADSLLETIEAPWRSLAPRLAQRRERATLLLVVEPAAPSGPPFDPLNRGPSRAVAFGGALEVRLGPGRRPCAHVVTGDRAVERLVRSAARGDAIEVVPSRSEAHPVAARLAQVAALVRDAGGDPPVALEAGGRVLVPSRGAIRRYPLARFAARPRRFVADPDAPDLALSPGERRRLVLGGPHTIDCRAHLVDEDHAAVLYADTQRGQLREVVLLADLEDHLRESRAILQAAHPASILAVRLSEDLEPAMRRAGAPGAPVSVAVRGKLPEDLQIEVGGQRFGGSAARGWSGAALAVLRSWPSAADGRLAISSLHATADGQRATGLLALYARSVAVRRLRVHLLRAARTYRPDGTGRQES